MKNLNQNEWNTEETEYVYYSPEKYGFNRIFFFLKDDAITRIRIENGIPQIIDPDTFTKVQAILDDRRNKTSSAKAHEVYLLYSY